MQGLSVVPLFAGFDLDRATSGRIFSYDVTGGCYEEHDHHSVGLRLAVRARVDEEAVAPGPGRRRGACGSRSRRCTTPPTTTPPPAARTSAAGSGRRWPSSTRQGLRFLPDEQLARCGRADRRRPPRQPRRCAMTMPFYVSPEQLMKDRADYARKGIARGRSVVVLGYDRWHRVRRREPLAGPAQGLRDLRPHRVRRRRQVQRVREPAGGRRPLRRPARLLLRPRGRHGPRPGQRLRPDPRHGVHPGVQALRGRDRRGRGRDGRGERPDLPPDLRRVGGRRAGLRGDGRCERAHQRGAEGALARRA